MELAIAPATAWLEMPMTPATNDGATALKSPITAKPANAAVAADEHRPHLGRHRQPL